MDKPDVPCGRTLGHGQSCCAGYLCEQCEYILQFGDRVPDQEDVRKAHAYEQILTTFGEGKTEEQVMVWVKKSAGMMRADDAMKEGDVVIDMGNMTYSTIEQAKLDEDFESMVEDYVRTFNHSVIQGVAPIRALVAMASAFAVILGCAIRSGLRPVVGAKFLSMIIANADKTSKQIVLITKQ